MSTQNNNQKQEERDEFYDIEENSNQTSFKDGDSERPRHTSSFVGEEVEELKYAEDLSLHRACFDNNVQEIERILKSLQREKWAELDTQGQTALHVAVYKGNKEAVRKLLQYDFPYNQKNRDRWKPLIVAIAQKDDEIAKIIIRYRIMVLKALRERQMQGIIKVFHTLEDCQFKIHWDFNSFFLWPLLRRYAPSDTYNVWKRGQYFRVDATMLGLDNKATSLIPQFKKGHFSLILDASEEQNPRIILVDRKKKHYWDVTSEVKAKLESSGEEGSDAKQDDSFKGQLDDMQLQMLNKNGPRKSYIKTEDFAFQPLKGWFGEDRVEKVDQYKTYVYQLEGSLVMVRKFKQCVVIPSDATFEDYLDMDLPQDIVREINVDPLKGIPGKGDKLGKEEDNDMDLTEDMYKDAVGQMGTQSNSGSQSPQVGSPMGDHGIKQDPFENDGASSSNNNNNSTFSSLFGFGGASTNNMSKNKSQVINNQSMKNQSKLKGSNASLQKGGTGGEKEQPPKKITCKCWMTQDFPMNLKQFLPVLQLVSTTNKVIGKAAEFIETFGKQNYFPIKVQVPLVFTIYITLSTLQFEIMSKEQGDKLGDDFFEVPDDYELKDVETSMANIAKEMQDDADTNVGMRDPKTGDEWFEQDNAGNKLFTALHERRNRKLQLQQQQQQQQQQKQEVQQ